VLTAPARAVAKTELAVTDLSPGTRRSFAGIAFTDVSEKQSAFMFKLEKFKEELVD
jgi:hypothetical protein